jgi:squalene-associated FAD-dependent desaturase
MTSRSAHSPTVAIIGGGLAGLAAGCALADSDFRVTLFERRPYLGGRASSYQHPGTNEVVDNCQHVLLGCCTNLIQFYGRLGVQDRIRWYDRLTFLEPGGRSSVIAASALPAPFHTSPSFLRAACLNLCDKLAIGRAMFALTFDDEFRQKDGSHLQLEQSHESFLDWLKRHQQTDRAIDRFWKTILVSALNEDLERISVRYAAQVVRESFLKSAEAGRMGVPTVPLSELYGVAGGYIQSRSGEIRLRSAVESFEANANGIQLSAGDEKENFDFAVLAVSFDVLPRLLPQTPEANALRSNLSHFESSPITGIHLWFDRQITDLDHTVLLDRMIQWMFHKSKLLASASRSDSADGSYVELVVSSSKNLVEKSKPEIVELALNEVREFFPAARNANLVKSTVIKEVNATYSPQPGVDAYRPTPETAWPRIFLAGDWIATGWPATMEGAVRSGYMAAESVSRAAGKAAKFLVADLPAAGLMRM